MSGQDARDVIAEALYVRANHPVPENEARTAWRDYAPDNLTRLRYLHMADAALDGLTAADFTVVELPEPSRTYGNREAKWTDRSSFSEPGYLKWSVGVTEGGIPFASARRGDGFLRSRAAADHAAFAAAILAAAAHAEAGEQ